MKRVICVLAVIVMMLCNLTICATAEDDSQEIYDIELNVLKDYDYEPSWWMSSDETRALLTVALWMDMGNGSDSELIEELIQFILHQTYVTYAPDGLDAVVVMGYSDKHVITIFYYSPFKIAVYRLNDLDYPSYGEFVCESVLESVSGDYFKNTPSTIVSILKQMGYGD